MFTKEVGLYPMTVELASNGLSVVSCTIPSPRNRIQLAQAYDLEAVAFDAANGTVWAADETRHTVKEYSLSDGAVLRALPLPYDFFHDRSNLGIEALALNADGKTLWICTEEALPCDGPRSSPTHGTTVRLLKYTRSTVQDNFTLAETYRYTTDAWCQAHDFRGKGRRGVSGLCALPDGSLLVLERELSFGGSNPLTALSTASLFFAVYRVDTTSGGSRLSQPQPAGGTRSCASEIRKEKLASGGGSVFTSGNYEGICLGPCLSDGTWSVLLIADAGDGASPPYILPMVLSLPPSL